MDSKLDNRQKFLIAATGALVLVTVLPLFDFNYWLIRIWDFPRPQIVVLALLLSFAVLILDKPTRRLTPMLSAAHSDKQDSALYTARCARGATHGTIGLR